jgi:phosphatidylglycerophosphate synthase
MTASPFFPLSAAAGGLVDGGMMRAIRPADEGAIEPAGEDVLTAVKDAPASTDAPPVSKPPASREARPTVLLTSGLGLIATAVVLGIVSATAGLAVEGWIAGLATGLAAAGLLAAARARSDQPFIHPADWVTLTRAVAAAGVAGLVAESFSRPASIKALVALSIVALVLDALDGQVARRTGTATSLGGRLDGEVDAFLILLLSIAVSRDYGWWVLAIGAARYVFLLAGWVVRWLAAPLPPRYWRKVVCAVQGIVLTVAVSGVVSQLVGMIAVGVALLLLAESFGRDVIWLCRHAAGPRTRRAMRISMLVLSVAFLGGVLLAPERLWQYSITAFIRIPVEALVLVAVALVLPPRPRRIVATIAGILFGLLAIDKILNIAFFLELDRAFNPVQDWSSIGPAVGVVRDAIGTTRTDLLVGAAWIGLALLAAAIIAATVHITTVASRHRRGTVRGLAALTVIWGLCAALSLQLVPGLPVASATTAGLADEQIRATQAALTDPQHFEAAIRSADPQAKIPASDLLTGLRGKDVIIVFVESYGQVAVRGTSFSPAIDSVLRKHTASLSRAGWSARSAWLRSPTFGGISWLAHSTLQSGLWVDTTQRYHELVASSRFTLSDAFNKAGWRTVSDDPSDNEFWHPGRAFYHYDKLYDRYQVGYKGPKFSYSSMPDQYTLAAFQRNELTPGHKPVMAEIDLTTSHIPWAPLPRMVPWSKLGDGSIFDPMPKESESAATVWRNASTVRKFYGQSIQYSLTALTTWVTELNDPNLVLIMLGDHQPHTTVSGAGANHDVPISIIARDPSVFRRIASWHWQDGLLPNLQAPLEPMDAFRNQFLGTFSKA